MAAGRHRRPARRHDRRVALLVGDAPALRRPVRASSCTTAVGSSRRSRSARRVPSSPPRRRRCRRPRAASATGTTATPGCATPASRSRRCGSPPAPTRPTSSSTSWRLLLRPRVHQGADLPIMFGIGGEHDLSERELPHLSGWRDSRPVRVGNGAWSQRQLDVYGELLDAAGRLSEHLERSRRGDAARSSSTLADAASARWRDPDQGIWEIRGEPRHFVYSKLMCWVALDRAIRLAERLPVGDRVDGVECDERRDRRRHPRRRVERHGRRVHPVLRFGRARRLAAS